MSNRNKPQDSQQRRKARRQNQLARGRRFHGVESLESRCVLAATLSGQVFDDLNGNQKWEPTTPNFEPALDCWTVYLDQNRNGALDDGEPRQLTGSDGSYRFDVANSGEYAIEVLQEPGFDRTTPIRFGLTSSVLPAAAQDHVFDPTQNLIYVISGNNVIRTNPKTGELFAGLALGTNLSAIDITPDGKFLLIGEANTSGGNGQLYKLNLASGAVTTISFALTPSEGGVFDLAAVSNDRVLFTTTSSTNGTVPLREVNLVTNASSIRSDSLVGGAIQSHSRLKRNATRSTVVLAQAHDATGSVHLYDTANNAFVRSAQLNHTLDNAHLAISRDGKLIAIQAAGLGLKVYDDQWAVAATLADLRGGIAFDSVRDLFYAGDTTADEFVAFSTSNWSEQYRVAVGEDLPASGVYYEMQIGYRAKYLSVTTPSGVRLLPLNRPIPHLVTVADNQTIGQLNFGNWWSGENRRPFAVANSLAVEEDATLIVNAPGVLGNDGDPDGDSLVTQLETSVQHGLLSLNTNGGLTYIPFGDYFGTDTFTYKSRDANYVSCRAATVTITIVPVNDAPTDITLSGSSTMENSPGAEIGQVIVVDADVADQFTFQVSDGRFEVANNRLKLRAGVSLDHEVAQSIALTITATDTGLPPQSYSKEFTITVGDVNEYDPSIDTTTIEAEEGSTTVGTVQTSDQDSGQVIIITITGGNGGGIFSIDPNTGVITVNAGHTLDREETQTHTITITASDNVQPTRTTSADVTITITGVNEFDPVINDQEFHVAENSPNGTAVGTVTATDADSGETLAYTISGGNDDGVFAIDTTSGAITVADSAALDRETTDRFDLTVTATDNGSPARSASATVTIHIDNVNEFEPNTIDQTVTIDENLPNDSDVLVVQATDPDAVSDLSFAITSGNDGGAFSIDSQTGVIQVASSAALDAEVRTKFDLVVTVTDNLSPSKSATAKITINLNDVNEFDPTLGDQQLNVPQDAQDGLELGTLTASDQDSTHTFHYSIVSGNEAGVFAIHSATGVVTVANSASLNSLLGTQYTLAVEVSDGGSPDRTDTATVTITVTPPNTHPPVAADATVSLPENSPNGTAVATVSATDADVGTILTYTIVGGNAGGAFALNASTGQITVADSSLLDFESTKQFKITVLVEDDGLPSKSDEAEITINLTDVNEFTPTTSDVQVTLDENTANGTVVASVSGSDGDTNQTVTFSMTTGAFAINATSGVITVADKSQLNYEATTQFLLNVTVSDNGTPAKSATAKVTVDLRDVNEAAPIVSNHTFNIDEHPPVGTVIGRVTATDADTRQTSSFGIALGNFGGAFTINANGDILVANSAAIDYETVPQILLLVMVTDSGSPAKMATSSVTINVRDVNESPLGVMLSGTSVPEHVPGATVGSVSAFDPDIGDSHTYSVDDSRFMIDAQRVLKLTEGTELDVDDASTITIKLTATDAGGLSTTQTYVITVTPNPYPYQNPTNPLDASGDGNISPLDVLILINEINHPTSTNTNGDLPDSRPPDGPFFDVNGDGQLTPLDVLIIINEINRRAAEQHAEGEAPAGNPVLSSSMFDDSDDEDWLSDLVTDVNQQWRG